MLQSLSCAYCAIWMAVLLSSTAAQSRGCDTFDVICVMDQSGSTNNRAWDKIKDFCRDVVRTFDDISPESRFGVVVFSTTARVEISLTSDQERVLEEINQLEHGNARGRTNIIGALDEVRSHLRYNRREQSRQVVFFVSDGHSEPRQDVSAAARRLKRWARVFAIGVGAAGGSQEFKDELGLIASENSKDIQHTYLVKQFEEIDSLADVINLEMVTSDLCLVFEDCEYVDILIMMDGSGSITHRSRQNWQRVQNFTINIIQQFPVSRDETRVSLILFTHNINVEFHLDELDKEDMIDHIRGLTNDNRGRTGIADALLTARREVFSPENGDRPNARNVAFLITDGEETERERDVEKEARALKEEDQVELFVVDVKDGRQNEIRNVASQPENNHYFKVSDFYELTFILDDLYQEVCSKNCSLRIDVSFLIDNSGSMGRSEFTEVIGYVADVIGELVVGERSTRVNALTFARTTRIAFGFDEYSSTKDVVNHIKTLRYRGGQTNLTAALETLRSSATFNRGRRTDAQQYVYLVTDGRDNMDTAASHNILTIATDMKLRGAHIVCITTAIERADIHRLYTLASHPPMSNIIDITTTDRHERRERVHQAIDITCPDDTRCLAAPGSPGCPQFSQHILPDDCPHRTGPQCNIECQRYHDIVLLVDLPRYRSRQTAFAEMAKAMVNHANPADDLTRVALITFYNSDQTQLVYGFSDYDNKQDLLEATVFYMRRERSGDIQEGLMAAQRYYQRRGDTPTRKRAVVLITDGARDVTPSGPRPATLAQAHRLKTTAGGVGDVIHLYVVGYGSRATERRIQSLATQPHLPYVHILSDNAENAPLISDGIITDICSS